MEEFNRYKDITPEETIARNKKALEDIGIEIKEDFVQNTKDIWTGRIDFPDIDFGTNGKGTSELFCKASAYGEALERIQNGISSVKWNRTSEEAWEAHGFNFFIDEEKGNLTGLLERYPYLQGPLRTNYSLLEHRNPSGIRELEALLREYLSEEIRYIPFLNYTSKNVEKLPYEVIEFLNGTNGLCSGNTPHEALVQGLSEVCERFVEPVIYENHLTPPEIPSTFLKKNYKYLFNIMKDLEVQSNSHLYVYDCSLGNHFPVVCVLMIEKNTQTYRLQYGAHPLFSIALERCLTELTQGYNLEYYTDVRRCTVPLNTKEAYTNDNMENRFILGNGDCNIEFFFEKPSWTWKEDNYLSPQNYTNKKGFDFLVSTLSQVSENIYIRDNSILGVPAYTIFIPGVTTYPLGMGWRSFENEKLFSYLENLPGIKKNLIKLNNLETWRNVCTSLLNFLNSHDRSFIREPYIYCPCFSDYEFLELLKACLYREIEDTPSLLSSLKSLDSPNTYIKSILMEEVLKKEGIFPEDRSSIIKRFLGRDECGFIENIWRSPSYLDILYNGEAPLEDSEKMGSPNFLNSGEENPYDKVLLLIKSIQKKRGPIDQTGMLEVL